MFSAVFYAVILTVIRLGNWPPAQVHIINIFSVQDKFYIVFIAYAFLHSIVIYGAIHFKKLHFIKTAFAFFVILFIIWLANDQLLQLMIHHKINGNPPFTGLNFSNEIITKANGAVINRDMQYFNVDLPDETTKWIFILFSLLSVMIWSAAYYKLKEKRV